VHVQHKASGRRLKNRSSAAQAPGDLHGPRWVLRNFDQGIFVKKVEENSKDWEKENGNVVLPSGSFEGVRQCKDPRSNTQNSGGREEVKEKVEGVSQVSHTHRSTQVPLVAPQGKKGDNLLKSNRKRRGKAPSRDPAGERGYWGESKLV